MSFKRTLQWIGASDKASTALILLSLTVILSVTELFQRIDYVLYDIGQQMFIQKAPDDVIVIAIDEVSLSKIGRWPWSRNVHAQLINKLSQEHAKVIALDLIMSEPETGSLISDNSLARAIEAAGNVVMPILIERSRVNGQLVETLPLPEFAKHAAALGSVHVVLDNDGLARGFNMYEGLGEAAWPHFTQAILQVTENSSHSRQQPIRYTENIQPYSLKRQDYYKVNFSGPPGHFKHISYVQVLAGEYEPDTFKDKITLVGATAVGLGDALPMSLTGLKQAMSGVEFHANILEATRAARLVNVAPKWVYTIICSILSLLPLIFLPKMNPAKGLFFSATIFVAVILMAAVSPPVLNVWIPVSSALVGILSAYPVWSWRRLEYADRFLNNQLQLIRTDLQATGVYLHEDNHMPQDVFMQHIAQVRNAADTLRELQQDRNEMLAFISHDVRAPLASLMLQLEEGHVTAEKMKQPLARALKLVEDFLHISRAEMVDKQNYKIVDLADLAHQAMDDAYAIAHKSNVHLKREISDDSIWVKGESGLLLRTMLNLLLNAIKFSPPDTNVILRVGIENKLAYVRVTDFGVGIEAERLPYLFDRFYKAENAQLNKDGTGMGLHFVKTVVEKHHGEVSVTSTPSVQTTFTIHLPLAHLN